MKLKDFYDESTVRRIGAEVQSVHPGFNLDTFTQAGMDGLDALELTDRARHICQALYTHLPARYEEAIDLLIRSLAPPLQQTELMGMGPFVYLPHVFFVAKHGLDHFEPSMRAQYELTQRFSAEYSIRFFMERYPEQTYRRLVEWATDPSVHVRRLVSEGTRPRLPWAPRLRSFQRDPQPVLSLLELLKDDPELFVRRSVANNLNDIGKDHPDLLVEVCARWLDGAGPERRWLVGHALRSLVKQGHSGALALLGFGAAPAVRLEHIQLPADAVTIGGSMAFRCDLVSESTSPQELLIDFQVHFVKANSGSSPKVFKLNRVVLEAGATTELRGRVSFAEMTTRQHYPGGHRIDLLVNGVVLPLGAFAVAADL